MVVIPIANVLIILFVWDQATKVVKFFGHKKKTGMEKKSIFPHKIVLKKQFISAKPKKIVLFAIIKKMIEFHFHNFSTSFFPFPYPKHHLNKFVCHKTNSIK